MIRKRLSSVNQSEPVSPQPLRRRISSIPSPPKPRDDRDLSDDDLAAALRHSQLSEARRVRDMLLQTVVGDIMSIVQKGLKNMKSSRHRRRVQSLLDRYLAAHPEHRLKQREEESREARSRRRRRVARRAAAAQEAL
jgi:hypothetical protein